MDQHWENLSENLKLSDESRERICARLATQPIQQKVISTKKRPLRLRASLAAAALTAALVVTALAVELTVGWESFLGRTPKDAVTPVGVSAVTGDYTLTLQESIVDDDGAAFLLALTRSDGQALEGKPELLNWDVKVDGEFPNIGMRDQQPIRSGDGKAVYYCVEFEAEGEEWDKDSVMAKTITFLCGGVMDTDWTEEELAMTKETVSLAPLAQTAQQLDVSLEELYSPGKREKLIPLVEEQSAQLTIPLTRPGEGKARVSAVFFSCDGCPLVAVDGWSGKVQQDQYLIGSGAALVLTDTRTGERWNCKGYCRLGDNENKFFLSNFKDCPLTSEDLPYVEVMVSYSIVKSLSDEPVELSFVASDSCQREVALDEDITFNYIDDCSVHLTRADISALRLRLTFDQMERAGWDWKNHPEKNTQWALVEKDGTKVLLTPLAIRERDEETGAGYVRLEGVDENSDRRLIDPDQVVALLIGDTEVPLR